MQTQYPIDGAPRKKAKVAQAFLMAAAFIAVFSLGVGIGSGSITVGPDRAFNKPVSKDLPNDLNYASVEQLYDILRKRYDGQLKESELLDGLKQGLAQATGDNYTEFLSASEAEEFNNDLNGTFSGIGAELGKEEKTVVIMSPMAGYPAAKAGLLPKDVIVEINGESAYDISVSEAVSKIRGEVGTKVKLKVVRDKSQELDFEITRQTIKIDSVESEILPGNIGYMKITRFSNDTAKLATDAAQRFKAANVKGVILDVRSNPGGLLDVAVSVSGLWMPSGKTVLQEKRDGVVKETFTSKGPATLSGIPTVVLIDEGSASASEIVAGALKDSGVASLMGMKSFGKGSVQSLEEMRDGGVLKVTIARWYTPNGQNIDKEGIKPDKEVKRTADDIKNAKDPQKDAAVAALQK